MPRASLRVQLRVSPWAAVLPVVRWVISLGLMVALMTAVINVRAMTLQGVGGGAEEIAPSPSGSAVPSPTPSVSDDPSSGGGVPSISPSASVSPEVTPGGAEASPVASPEPLSEPEPLLTNIPPFADAGDNQVVSPSALVVLNGARSRDPKGTSLDYHWRQVDGPVVDLTSTNTVNPSFLAGSSKEVYIFSLTVRDINGAVDGDTVVVATRELAAAPVASAQPIVAAPVVVPPPTGPQPTFVRLLLRPLNLTLIALSFIITTLMLLDRVFHVVSEQRLWSIISNARDKKSVKHQIRVVQYQTNEGLAGVRVTVLRADGTVATRQRTNSRGVIALALGRGQYALEVHAKGFSFSPPGAAVQVQEGDVLYAGGRLNVTDGAEPLSIVVPLKPAGETVSSLEAQALELWQLVQRFGHVWSWPVFVVGALLNTVLMLLLVERMYLTIELFYVGLVLAKIVLEVRLRPSYGLVRDAITRIPLDLAVVRLYEQGTNRLVLTRVTNDAGKFFALPPPGVYNVVVSKTGYATFTKEQVAISGHHDTVLRLKANLMPVVPQGAVVPALA